MWPQEPQHRLVATCLHPDAILARPPGALPLSQGPGVGPAFAACHPPGSCWTTSDPSCQGRAGPSGGPSG